MKRITKMKTNDCYHTKNKKQEGQTIDLCLSNRKDFSSVSVDTRKGNFPISFTKLNKMKIFARIFLILLFVFALHITLHTLNSYAAVPHLINYQGRLTDTAGVPLNGTYTLTFRIYDAETAGSLFWQGTYSVSIQKGIFAVLLGDINDTGYNFSSLAFDKAYFLEIKVGAEVMSPRQRIASVGYAIKAEAAEQANQAKNADTVANVGISTTPAANKILPLDSSAKIPLTALGLKVYDSGWFAVAANTAYSKTHNLGTTKVIYNLWYSVSSDGSNARAVGLQLFGPGGFDGYSCDISTLTTTQITLSTGFGVYVGYSGGYVAGQVKSSGYYRLIMLALE